MQQERLKHTALKVLAGRPVDKNSYERPRRRCNENIKMTMIESKTVHEKYAGEEVKPMHSSILKHSHNFNIQKLCFGHTVCVRVPHECHNKHRSLT
jgi:hypothetical protein